MANRALSNQMNRTVVVDRLRLIETLKANRERHVLLFDEAMKGYVAQSLEKVEATFRNLDSQIAEQKSRIIAKINSFTADTADQFSDHLTILNGISVQLVVPKSYRDAYDAAIDMAEFDTRPELELSGAEFQCFVRDVWEWTAEFRTTGSRYGGMSGLWANEGQSIAS